jgi:hypothetical protein
MKVDKKIIVLALSISFLSLASGFAQEPSSVVENLQLAQQEGIPDIQWLWGEVVTVDTENKTLVIRTLDYEASQEKEVTVNVDEKTTYENAQSLDQIKPKDTLSIDYIIGPDGKNIAKNIGLEKPEGQEPPLPEAVDSSALNSQAIPVSQQ